MPQVNTFNLFRVFVVGLVLIVIVFIGSLAYDIYVEQREANEMMRKIRSSPYAPLK